MEAKLMIDGNQYGLDHDVWCEVTPVVNSDGVFEGAEVSTWAVEKGTGANGPRIAD